MKNIMSVDLEDYFCDLPLDSWKNYQSRVEKNTNTLLDLFEKHKVTATFFTLGYVAEKHPELIEKIVSKGHEIASHGYYHYDIRKMDKTTFETDLINSLNILKKFCGEKINGFRAPFFSINTKNLWVFEILKKYLKYDSSIFPVRTPLYGIPNAPNHIYYMSNDDPLQETDSKGFIEIPLSTLKIPVLGNIPIAGGFYLRFLPLSIQKFGIRKINDKGFAASCYIHPKDIDPEMPKISQYAWHYYWGLGGAKKKFESILKCFNFSSARDVLSI